MSLETLYKCNCANPKVALDKVTGQEYDLVCGGVIPDDDYPETIFETEMTDAY